MATDSADSDLEKYEYSLSQGAADDSVASEKTLKCVRIIFDIRYRKKQFKIVETNKKIVSLLMFDKKKQFLSDT